MRKEKERLAVIEDEKHAKNKEEHDAPVAQLDRAMVFGTRD
jgi:hypothetical protein